MSINLKKTTEKLRQTAEGSKVIGVPEGEPLFLFSSAMGAPDLHVPTTTREDVKIGTKMNKFQQENCVNQAIEFFNDNEFDKNREELKFKENVKKIFDDNKKDSFWRGGCIKLRTFEKTG